MHSLPVLIRRHTALESWQAINQTKKPAEASSLLQVLHLQYHHQCAGCEQDTADQ